MMKYLSILLIFQALYILEISILNVIKVSIDKNQFIERNNSSFELSKKTKYQKYALNKKFVVNNNLAQYSSYLFIDQYELTGKINYRIEAIIHFNYKYIKTFGMKENFTCVLKLIANDGRKEEKLIELEAVDSPKFYWNVNKKIIFNLDLQMLKNYSIYRDDDDDLIINNIAVAVIWKYDFNKLVDMNSLLISNTLPYNLIKFQVPTIIKSKIPRLKTIGICVPFTYAMPQGLKEWIDFHLSFGVREIIMYDSVDRNLTNFLKSMYGEDDRLSVNSFDIGFDDLCNEKNLFKQYNEINITQSIKIYLTKTCKYFYDKEFHDKYSWRYKFEQLTSNDCFTIMKEKYEFIGYYDFDEFVFPRTIENVQNLVSKSFNSMNKFAFICSIEPFQNIFNSTKNSGNYFYNYLQSLIAKNKNGRDVNILGSINFNHALYLFPNDNEKQLMNSLGLLIEKITTNNNSTLFPLSILLKMIPSNKGHIFIIEKEDIDYIKYLYNSYKNLMPFIYENYLKNLTRIYGDTFIRYLYFVTDPNQRMGKQIHYYKNIKSVFVHYAVDSANKPWSFTASSIEGHILPHYRNDFEKYYSKRNLEGSIRNVNIDFEYLTFLLKRYTSFCKN